MVIEPIVWRRSVREYSSEPVLDSSIMEIIKAAQFAPTAMDKRAVEFVVVKDQAVKNELFAVLQQDFVKKAPVLVVPVCDTRTSILPETDLAVAGAFIMIQAVALGLGTVWKHIDQKQGKAICKILALPEDFKLINLIPVGHPLDELPDHGDKDFSVSRIHFDRYL